MINKMRVNNNRRRGCNRGEIKDYHNFPTNYHLANNFTLINTSELNLSTYMIPVRGFTLARIMKSSI